MSIFMAGFRILIAMCVLLPTVLAYAGKSYPVGGPDTLFKHQKFAEYILYFRQNQDQVNRENDTLKAQYFLNLAKSYYRLGHADSSVLYARKVAVISNKDADSLLMCHSFLLMGWAYSFMEHMDSASTMANRVLQYAFRNGQKPIQLSAYKLLAALSNKSKLYEDALSYYLKSFQLSRENGDSSSFAVAYFNLSLTYFNLDNNDTAALYIDSAQWLAQSLAMNDLLSHVFGLKSAILKADGDVSGWEKTIKKAMLLSLKNQNMSSYGKGLGDLMQHYLNQQNYLRVIELGNEAVEILTKHQEPALALNVHNRMKMAFEGLGNLKMALYHDSIKDALESLLYEQDMHEKLQDVSAELELNKQKNVILQKDVALKSRRNSIIILVGLLLIFFVLLIFVVFSLLQYKKKIKILYIKEKEISQHFDNTGAVQIHNEHQDSISEIIDDHDSRSQNLYTIYDKLLDLLRREKLYLDPDMNQKEIVTRLGTNQKYLSDAISQFDEGNFRNIINRYRIQKAKSIMQEHSCKSMSDGLPENLYNFCGFNSNTSFYRTFKNMTGLTPLQYFRQYCEETKGRTG